jgi:peptidoglycan-associated lipoprotein
MANVQRTPFPEDLMPRVALVCLAALTVLAGCAKQPGLTQATAPSPSGTATKGAAAPGIVRAAAAQGGSSRSTPAGGGAAGFTGTARPRPGEFTESRDLRDIHFDFDRYELREGDRHILDGHAAWMKEHAGTLMLIEGHCDERGTNEYNVSLGERRAKTTANYLISRGVAAERISMVSYGEERPVCQEHNEACWKQNRRAHFLVKQP